MTIPLKVRIGAVAWGAFVLLHVSELPDVRWTGALLLLSALVLMPMTWCLARDLDDTGWAARLWRFDLQLQLPAALLLIPAFWLPVGKWALLCALPWALVLGVMAVDGIIRIRRHGFAPLGPLCRDVGLLYASVGGLCLLAERAGWEPLGLTSATLAHQAVHFHYFGFVLPVVAGLAQSRRPECPISAISTWLVILGVPLVAITSLVTKFGGTEVFQSLATWLLVAGGCGVAWQHLMLVIEEKKVHPLARGLWLVAGVSLAGGMLLAGLHASRLVLPPLPWLDLPWMLALHGTLNALGFSLAAVLAWCRAGRGCCCGRT